MGWTLGNRSTGRRHCKWFLGWIFFAATTAHGARICRSCEPHRFGDLVHRDSPPGALFVGHTGLFIDGQVVDVAAGRKFGKALARIPYQKFKDGGAFWGAKFLKGVTPQMADSERELLQSRILDKIEFLMRSGVDYDYLHTSQKGKKTSKGRFLFDCVGFTEHIWESLGFDPTPNEYEGGWGWPLTVREQRDSPRLEHVGP